MNTQKGSRALIPTYGRWSVLSGHERQDAAGRRMLLCACSCGSEPRYVDHYFLKSGRSKSCGCYRAEVSRRRQTTHGKGKTPEYRNWSEMIQRCTNDKRNVYHIYGAAGVSVCDRWRDSFEAFFEDMGPRPTISHSLDRWPNPNGNYEPGNVRWATPKQQARNRSTTLQITRRGQTKCLSEWCEVMGVSYGMARSRIRRLGWTPEQALTTPKGERRASA